MTAKSQNFLLIFALFFIGIGYGQSCETTSIETSLYSPSLIIECDFNGDGAEDLVFLDSLSNNLFWKKNNGSDDLNAASPLVGGAPIKFLTSCDLNNDNKDDIIFATSNIVYYIIYASPTSIDFDDLYTVPVLYKIDAITTGDFNNDGSDGIVLAYSRTSTLNAKVDVIKNDDGSLALQNIYDGTIGSVSDLAVGDISKNGKLDIAMAGYNNFWFRNNGVGVFSTHKTISSASSDFGKIALLDYDNDSDVELVVLNNDGDLISYDIDLTDGGWIYSPATLLSDLPTAPQTWEHVSLNGNDVLLLTSENEILGLENIGDSFTKVSYCSAISDLNGLSLFHRADGYIHLVFSKESGGTLEKINDTQTNDFESYAFAEAEVAVYPNPTSNTLFIEAANGSAINRAVAINSFGQRFELEAVSNLFSVSHLPQGVYHFLITDSSGAELTKTVVIKR